MIFASRFGWARLLGWARLPVMAAGLTLAIAVSAAAQTPAATDEADEATEDAAPVAEAADANDVDILKDIDESKLDWSQLNTDPTTLPALAPRGAKANGGAGSTPAWSSNLNANGTEAVAVKQSVSPFLDTRVGADMTVAKQDPQTTSEQLSERLANGGSLPQSGGSAWASISAPGVASVWDKTSVEARIDPGAEQSKIGTSLSKQVPLSDQYSVTLENGINMTQQGVVPVPGIVSRATRSYDADQSARLSVNDTGTSITAGQTSTFDDKWLRRVGAEQKLFDGVIVSGSIGETAQGTTSKSISAGFKRTW
jgi:hypothetical protein